MKNLLLILLSIVFFFASCDLTESGSDTEKTEDLYLFSDLVFTGQVVMKSDMNGDGTYTASDDDDTNEVETWDEVSIFNTTGSAFEGKLFNNESASLESARDGAVLSEITMDMGFWDKIEGTGELSRNSSGTISFSATFDCYYYEESTTVPLGEITITLVSTDQYRVIDLITEASDNRGSISPGTVEEFVIGSFDVWAYAYEDGNFQTHEFLDTADDNKCVLSGNSMRFAENDPDGKQFNPAYMPDTIDIIYFNNEWQAVKVDDTWYGDVYKYERYPNVSNAKNWLDIDDDGVLDENELFSHDLVTNDEDWEDGNITGASPSFDIIFLNNTLISEPTLFNYNRGGDFSSRLISGDAAAEAVISKVREQIYAGSGFQLFIPIDPIDTSEIDEIYLGVNLTTLIEDITDGHTSGTTDPEYRVEYSIDADGSPFTYNLTTE